MTILNPDLQRRLNRVARILDRAKRWERLAFMDETEADQILMEHDQDTEACSDMNAKSCDDGSYPAGPRKDKNKSRYQVSPGHSQHLSDLLRNTAETKAMRKISKLLNG
jgi:hypothetical protein